MLRPLLYFVTISLLVTIVARADDHTREREAWKQWKTRPVTDSSFRAVCDLIQDVGKTNIQLGYQILSEYLPMIKATGNKDWVHIILMGWAKAKESLASFGDAEDLYRQRA